VITYSGKGATTNIQFWEGPLMNGINNLPGHDYTGLPRNVTNCYIGSGNRFPLFTNQVSFANIYVVTGHVWTYTDVTNWLVNVCTNVGYDFSSGMMDLWDKSIFENTFSSWGDYGTDGSRASRNGAAIINSKDDGNSSHGTDGTNVWMVLDGVNDYYGVRVNTEMNPQNSNYAAQAWIMITNNPAAGVYPGIYECGGWGGNPYFRIYYDPTRKPVLWCRDDTGSQTIYLTPTNVMETNKWYHLVGYWNGANIAKLWMNTNLIACLTNNSFGTISGVNGVCFGRLGYLPPMYHLGFMDNCTVWKGIDIEPYVERLFTNRNRNVGFGR
jgi:hypothetical protein